VRALITHEHNCKAGDCPKRTGCLFAKDFDIVISADATVTVCSTLEPDISRIRVVVCVFSNEAANRIQKLEEFWEVAELFPRQRFTFESISDRQVVSLLQSQIPNLQVNDEVVPYDLIAPGA